jgi:hypothetical protein
MAETLDIGTLSGRIELEDRMSNILTLTEKALEKFDEQQKKTGEGAESLAAGVFKGELALDALKQAGRMAMDGLKDVFDMMVEGGKVLDIEDSFKRMSDAAGIVGDTLVTKVQAAMKGTIDDTDVMKRANENMAAGLALSVDQMETLAKGAWALGKAMGIDTTSALDRLSDAMVTGRTRGIAMLTGKIDLARAEEDFAKKLGVTTDLLTTEGKLESTRSAILEKVAASTERIGETTVRFGDKVQQAKIIWDEFWEKVSVGLERSPVLAAMVDHFGESFRAAFGGSQTDAVETMVKLVEDVAIGLMSVGEVATDVAGVLGFVFYKGKEGFDTLMLGIYDTELGLAKIAKAAYEVGEALMLPGAAEGVQEMAAHIKSVEGEVVKWADAADANMKKADEWAVATGKFKEALEGVRSKMVDAQKSAGAHTEAQKEATAATEAGARAADGQAEAQKKASYTMEKTKEEAKALAAAQKELASVTEDYRETVAKMDPEMVATIKRYLDAGVSQSTLATAYGVTASQMSAVNKERQEEIKAMKIEEEAANVLAQMWIQYGAQKAMLYATDTEKSRIAADADYQHAVEAARKKHIVDQDYYDQLAQLRDENIKLDEQARLLADDRTLAALEQRIAEARDMYQFMLRHGRDYTDATQDQQYEIWMALEDQRSQWGKVGDQIQADTGHVNTMTAAVQGLAGQMSSLYESTVANSQAANASTFGGSWAVTKDTFQASMQAAHAGVSMEFAEAMAMMGYSYGEIIGYRAVEDRDEMRFLVGSRNIAKGLEKLINTGMLPPPQGPRIPGFQEGGIGDFGAGTLVMLHGKEAIVPLGGPDGAPGIGGGSSIVVHNYVNGTAADVARQISAEIMRKLASVRQFSFGS